MAWTTPRTWVAGEVVPAVMMNAHVRDNLTELRAGGFALASQAIGDLIYASSTTQFSRLADVATGSVLVSGGVGVAPAWSTAPTCSIASVTGTLADARLSSNVPLKDAANVFSAVQHVSGALSGLPGWKVTETSTSDTQIWRGVRSGGTAADWLAYMPAGSTNLILYSGGDRFFFGAAASLGIGITPASVLHLDKSGAGNYVRFSEGGTLRGLFGVSAGGGDLCTSDADNDIVLRYQSRFLLANQSSIAFSLDASSNAAFASAVSISGHLTPGADDTYNVGSASLAWNRLFVANGSAAAPSLTFGNHNTTGLHTDGTLGWIMLDSNGVNVAYGYYDGTDSSFGVASRAAGTGGRVGPYLFVGRNTSGSGAAGLMVYTAAAGGLYPTWVDAAGDLRIVSGLAAAPQEDGTPADTTGTVVGTQTSLRAAKRIYGRVTNYGELLSLVLSTPLFDFAYRNGRYNGQRFTGITTDDSPWFGLDRDAEHPQGKSLNDIALFGALIASVKVLHDRIAHLEATRC